MPQKYEANKWKMKTFFFETAGDFLSLSLSIGTPAWKWIDGKQNNSFPAKCFHSHQMASSNETHKMERKNTRGRTRERESAILKETPHYTSSMPPRALWTLHLALV